MPIGREDRLVEDLLKKDRVAKAQSVVIKAGLNGALVAGNLMLLFAQKPALLTLMNLAFIALGFYQLCRLYDEAEQSASKPIGRKQ